MGNTSRDTVVRGARMRDAAALADLARRTFRETFVEDFAIPYPAEDLMAFEEGRYTVEAMAAQLADPSCAAWIAELGETAVGYATAGPCTLPHPDAAPGEMELKCLYVARAAQGSGAGRALLDAAMAWMATRGDGAIWLGVWSGNLKAQAVYAARGFVKVGEYAFPVGRWRDREFILRRDPRLAP